MTKPLQKYERKLSGVERFSMAINEIHRYSVDGFAVGTGTIDANDLRRAVAAAAQANPGMRVRLKGVLGFSKWVDSGVSPEVIEIDAPEWDFNSNRNAGFLCKRFEPLAGGPIADILLIRGKDKIGVMFRGLHAAADGRAIMHWGQEVFRALRGEPLVGGESTIVDFEVAERFREKLNAGKASSEESEADKNNSEKTARSYIPVVPPSSTADSDFRYIWRTLAIPKRITTILPRAAVFLAAYARQRNEGPHAKPDGSIGFTVPVDYRGLRIDADSIEARSTGNLTGYLRIQVSPDDTPKTIMQQINRQIREYVDCHLPMAAKPLRWMPMFLLVGKLNKQRDAVLYTPNSEIPTGGLVSMGYNDLNAYSTPTFVCERSIGIPGSVGKLNIVAVNCSETTFVTFSAPQNYNRDGQLDRMIDAFAAEFSS